MSFFDAYKTVQQFEGVESYDPMGGQTYCGIARKKHPEWQGWLFIDQCKEKGVSLASQNAILTELVMNFYRQEFWIKLRCQKIEEAGAEVVANELFEASVNCGPENGARFLQRALNELNINQKLYPDLIDDGDIGGKTMLAIAACLKSSSNAANLIFKCQNGEQYIYYKSLPAHERYRGWYGRT